MDKWQADKCNKIWSRETSSHFHQIDPNRTYIAGSPEYSDLLDGVYTGDGIKHNKHLYPPL